MKKRILALALAGTTAFSVFGAAVSANAYDNSTHNVAGEYIDSYVSYDNVAEKINVTAAKAAATKNVYVDVQNAAHGDITEANLETYLATRDVQENYTGVYYIAGSNKYLKADKSGLTDGTDLKTGLGITVTHKDGDSKDYYDFKGTSYDTLDKAIDAAIKGLTVDYYWTADWSSTEHAKRTEIASLPTKAQYKEKNLVVKGTTTEGTAVTASVSVNTNDEYTNWTFDSDLTGEATVSVYGTTTSIVNGSIKVTTVPTPTVYAYDFLPVNNTVDNAATIAYNWNAKKEAETAASLLPYGATTNTATLTAENGRGRVNVGVRYDVVSNWQDFLDKLAINGDNGYKETEAQFIKNYKDMFYTRYLYNQYTGQLDYTQVVKSDLYNITELLHDIYALNTSAEYYKANTSEMVYLMQQYEKYVGNYFDTTEVSESDWGKLMLNVLDSVEADNFKKATDYKKYTRQVEDLQDAYENATTVSMINSAERGMYELLTKTPYTAASSDKKDLNSTINGLYFNAKSAPVEYATDASTLGNALYSNYAYIVNVGKTVNTSNGREWQWTTTYGNGFYSLYPAADYAQSGNVADRYAGNDAAADTYKVYTTDEYEWFLNVYQLANLMKSKNGYQGAINAINEALNKAVDALEVTTTPYATETSAKDEMVKNYADKIESDYNTGYYNMYTAANDFASKAEGKYQTRIALEMVKAAGESLTYQGTQITVTKNDIKSVETAIKNAQAAVKSIKDSADYNAAQVTALNKAIANAQAIIDLYNGTASNSSNAQSVNHAFNRTVGDKDQIVKSDITNAVSAIDSAINYSNVVMGWSKNDAGKWQYGTKDGYLSNGWNKVGKTWFYFNADGTAKQSEWLQENGKWYYFNSNCGALCGWGKVDGNWYYFKGDNHMKTGWEKVDGNWYYLASSGKMVTGWTQIDGKWYYFSKESNSLGQMLANTTVDGYKLDANGVWNK